DVTVSVRVCILFNPGEGGFDLRTQLLENSDVAGPESMAGDQHQPERGRVDGTGIGSVRDFSQARHFSAAPFMQNFAKLFLPPRIYFFSLKLCQEPDCLFRNRRIISQRLQGGDNTVPPKESDEPWHAGSEVGNVVSQLASQHIEIPQRSLEHSIKQ